MCQTAGMALGPLARRVRISDASLAIWCASVCFRGHMQRCATGRISSVTSSYHDVETTAGATGSDPLTSASLPVPLGTHSVATPTSPGQMCETMAHGMCSEVLLHNLCGAEH